MVEKKKTKAKAHKKTAETTAGKERYVPPIETSRRRDDEQEDRVRRMAIFTIEPPQRKLADLVIPDATREQLHSLLTRIRYQHVLYDDFGLRDIDPYGGRTAINLYGPPGTGKTFAAEAIAHELGMGLLRVNYSEIESKFVGETPKNIQAAFARAQAENALLFFDEADSILGKRLTNISQSTDHAVNVSRSVMLMALDRFSGVAVFATNLASNYDTAFVRRILGHVEMPLPNAAARRQLWQAQIPARLPADLTEKDWARLVRETEGLAGGDILNSVVLAAATAIQREGPACRVGVEDFSAAVAAAKKAKREIGVARKRRG
ncbi:MAG: ATP-binding protein [Anaerolineae bacterium]|nr:MAG: ATP-binding protein [Anaerolineae bacterium]